MKNTKKLVFCALLTAVALGIWVLEAQIPSIVPVPGVKLGFANIITLVAMALIGRREAGYILCARILLGALFSASFSTILYSFSGGVAAWLVMAVCYSFFPGKKIWLVSVIGAVAHNLGQLVAASCVIGSVAWASAPVLLLSGIITGAFTGIICVYLVPALSPHIRFPKNKEKYS